MPVHASGVLLAAGVITIHHAGPVRVFRLDGMPANTICINGDKGDVAALTGLPMLLFDDREENLDDVLKKGISGCEGVLVRRGSASQRRVPRRWREHLINDSQQWIHRGIRFVEQFPLRKPQHENQTEEACAPGEASNEVLGNNVLPMGWQEFFDPRTRAPYYHHAATNVTQWRRPVERIGNNVLPLGWQEFFDPKMRAPYYHHAGTNVTQWERPVEPAVRFQYL